MSEAPATARPSEPVPPGVVEELDLTMFVPCYNEEERITGTLETIKAAMAEVPFSYEVIVVDDGSRDRTCEMVAKFQQENPGMPVRLRKNPRNLGLARGFVETSFHGRGRYYRLVCGDNAVTPLPDPQGGHWQPRQARGGAAAQAVLAGGGRFRQRGWHDGTI